MTERSIATGTFAAFDCSFTEQQLSTMTTKDFVALRPEQKGELALLFQASEIDEDAAELYLSIPDYTAQAIQMFALGVPPTIYQTYANRKSSRGIALQMTLQAIGVGFAKGLVIHGAEHVVTLGLFPGMTGNFTS